jgi:hypothetical protein
VERWIYDLDRRGLLFPVAAHDLNATSSNELFTSCLQECVQLFSLPSSPGLMPDLNLKGICPPALTRPDHTPYEHPYGHHFTPFTLSLSHAHSLPRISRIGDTPLTHLPSLFLLFFSVSSLAVRFLHRRAPRHPELFPQLQKVITCIACGQSMN